MLRYFVDKNEPNSPLMQKVLSGNRRVYSPFHLDCPISKRTLCYCEEASFTQAQKVSLWTDFKDAHSYWTESQAKKKEAMLARELYLKCRQQIRELSREELKAFLQQSQKE